MVDHLLSGYDWVPVVETARRCAGQICPAPRRTAGTFRILADCLRVLTAIRISWHCSQTLLPGVRYSPALRAGVDQKHQVFRARHGRWQIPTQLPRAVSAN